MIIMMMLLVILNRAEIPTAFFLNRIEKKHTPTKIDNLVKRTDELFKVSS